MKYIKLCVVLMLNLALLLSGCHNHKASDPFNQDFEDFTNQLWKDMVTQDAFTLHGSLADPASFGLDPALAKECSSRLPEQSTALFQSRFTQLKTWQKELSSFENSSLSPSQLQTKKILLSSMEKELALEPYILYQNPLAASYVGNLARTFYLYSFERKEDVDTYLSLLSQVKKLYDSSLQMEKERRKEGIYLNQAQVKATLNNARQMLSTALDDNIFIKDFNGKIEELKDLTPQEKTDYQQQNREIVENILLPACRDWQRSLAALPTASDKEAPICTYPQGKDYYEKLLQYTVGTDLSPQESMDLFQRQIDDARRKIQKCYKENPDLYTAYQLAVPELTDSREILKELAYDTLIAFPETEAANYKIEEMPDTLSVGSSVAFYQIPVMDQRRTNRLYVNSSELKSISLFPTLAHEAFPGHMYQVNYALDQHWNPIRYVNSNAGYDEGWGFYAQIYSYQFMQFSYNEAKENKALQEIFAQKDLLNTSLFCLSDLCVNYKGYDAAQLAKFLKQYGVEKTQAKKVYQTVLASPGAYFPYGLGYLELQSLLEEMKEDLKDQFDLKEFHQMVLDAGSCTFPVLKEYVKNHMK